jgi:lipopolysaccharide biosynthesis regulator YciM
MAQIYIQMDNPVKAEESLRLAMNGGKKSAKIYTLQGTLAAKDGDLQGAQQAYRMALSMDQDYAPAHLELGLARIAVQDLAGGVTELKKYLELAGDSREARGPEIKLLVGQLEQTLEKAGAAPGQSAAEAATRVAQEDAQ